MFRPLSALRWAFGKAELVGSQRGGHWGGQEGLEGLATIHTHVPLPTPRSCPPSLVWVLPGGPRSPSQALPLPRSICCSQQCRAKRQIAHFLISKPKIYPLMEIQVEIFRHIPQHKQIKQLQLQLQLQHLISQIYETTVKINNTQACRRQQKLQKAKRMILTCGPPAQVYATLMPLTVGAKPGHSPAGWYSVAGGEGA